MSKIYKDRFQIQLDETRIVNFCDFLEDCEKFSDEELLNVMNQEILKIDTESGDKNLSDSSFGNENNGKQENGMLTQAIAGNIIDDQKVPYYKKALSNLIERIEYSGYKNSKLKHKDSISESSYSRQSLDKFIEFSDAESNIESLTQIESELQEALLAGFYAIPSNSFNPNSLKRSKIIEPLLSEELQSSLQIIIENINKKSSSDEIINKLKQVINKESKINILHIFRYISDRTGINVEVLKKTYDKQEKTFNKKSILLDLKKKILDLKSYLGDLAVQKIKWNQVAESQLIEIEDLLNQYEASYSLSTNQNKPEKFDKDLFKKLHLSSIYQRKSSRNPIAFHQKLLPLKENPRLGRFFPEIENFPVDDFIIISSKSPPF